MRWRVLALVAGLLGTLVLGSVLARGDGPARLDDLAAGRVPDAAPPAGVVSVAEATTTLPQPDPRWVRRTSATTGVPRPALRAYGRAEIVVAAEDRDCHLGWTTLAGIGWVESEQGSTGGRVLGSDGVASTPIAGPVLTDGTRAYGPMQFLPSTWTRWAADGDGDGLADIDDLDDAALAAGRYLCADGHDLATGPAWGAAVYSYNHSWEYVNAVYSAAQVYDLRARR